MATLTPQEFHRLWQNTTLNERQSYQLHFLDVCKLVGYEAPGGSGKDSHGHRYAFEYGVQKDLGGQGFADVFYENHFAIEYKAPGKYKDLADAYQQLLRYRENLLNPPLLVVTDIATWEIHTNWPNTEKKIYRFTHDDILHRATVRDHLRALFETPERLHPRRNTEQVTADAARVFQLIADNMRDWEAEPERIAHFLTKLVFCLFAEDVGLLPTRPGAQAGIFSDIVQQTRTDSARFERYTRELFQAMADGGELMFARIPYFNGTLFEDVQVEPLTLEALTELERASRLNWSAVEPAIFGTLFERSLDPGKRAQLGAHYTSREDILLIVEPVLMQPLRREWAAIQAEAAPIRARYDEALQGSNRRLITTYGGQLEALRQRMLTRLREMKVLDPACGSGNFLYVSLQLLMDMEKAVIHDPLFTGLSLPYPEVHPRQMYGIEKDPIAHALASIVVWIGYLQWQQNNGYLRDKEPILEDLHENIRCMDAIMNADGSEPDWPPVDVIVGNPPFLGGSLLRGELGDAYYEALTRLYAGRVPGFADLVCYWFEKARAHIEQGKVKRAGLLATNSIRGGVNREVLKRIKDSGGLFMAWSDREWTLDGAAVRISMVGFDDGTQDEKTLDGAIVGEINADLTGDVDITQAKLLKENTGLAFRGNQKGGAFDIDAAKAKTMLEAVNPSGRPNRDVIKPWWNGLDVTGRPRNMWLIDFGINMSLEEASLYEAPLAHVWEYVKPERDKNNRRAYRERWWIHNEARPSMRKAIKPLTRYLITPHVSKHRLFVWLDKDVVPDHQLIVVATEDDYFFGVLHSWLHQVWSLRMGTSLGPTPRYTPVTTFETFPFPWSPGHEDTSSPAYVAISAAAKALHEERAAWLNPPGMGARALKDRTLTNLYNALNGWRGVESIKVKPDAADFAPRLDELHRALDSAVCAAYGWDDLAESLYTAEVEESVLRRLLALNLERASAENQKSR